MKVLNGLDLFSGIGGLALALAPWVRPIIYCERDRYCHAVLLSRMRQRELPSAPIWNDITSLRSTMLPRHGGIDIIYGGFPCQNISIAGDGAGLGGEHSSLFFELLRLARDIRPRFIFLENVPAITHRGLERILLEFTALGYDSRWTIVSAGELGAKHLRERWFLLAHAVRAGLSVSGDVSTEASSYRGSTRTPALSLVQNKVWNEALSDIRGMDDGLPVKIHRIRALGNAVVPIQAQVAFKRLMGLQ